MAVVKTIFDFLLVLFKVLSMVPEMLDQFQRASQDGSYKTTNERLIAAFNAYVKAKHEANILAQLTAAHSAASGGKSR